MNFISKLKNYLPVAITITIGLIAIGQTISSHRFSQHILAEQSVLATNLSSASNNISIGHLWLEEYLTGDTTIDIKETLGLYEKTVALLDETLTHEKVIARPDLLKEIKSLRELSVEFHGMAIRRSRTIETSGIGTDIDQQFDDAFRKLLSSFKKIFSAVEAHKMEEEGRSHMMHYGIMFSWLVIIAFAAIFLYRYEIRRKKAEEELRDSQIRYHSLFQYANDSIFIVDPSSHKFLEVNENACKRLGYSKDEMLNMKVDNISFPHQSLSMENLFRKLEEKGSLTIESAHRRKDGSEMNVEVSTRIIRHGEKQVIQSIARDISKRKQNEDALRKAKEDAEEATKLKDKFVSLVSHDLRGPLGTMMGFVQLLSKEDFPIKEREYFYNMILESGKNMTKMISDILNISRIQTGKLVPKLGFIDAFMIAIKAVTDFAHPAKEKGLKLINKVPEKSYIYADSGLYAEVIHNLVSNALKFCEKGDSITLYIPDGEPSTIAVKDTGIGINAEKQKILFDHDKKTSTEGTAGEIGTGFGMPLSQDIMQAHGGELTVESKEGKGTTFYAKLPHVKPKIVIVDDDEVTHNLLLGQLKELDTEIIGAKNGKEALLSVQSNLPHLVITDLQMPFMDGFELIDHLKKDSNTDSIPIMVITSDNNPETRKKSFKFGVQDFIQKPLVENDILSRAKRLIGYL